MTAASTVVSKTPQPSRPVIVGMISLGCAKNLVDAEIMLGRVRKAGMQITAQAEEADVVIVNTCSFIDTAKEESIENVFEMNRLRGFSKRGPRQAIIMAGCMAQRFATELQKEIPEVDAFMGIDQVEKVDEIILSAIEHRLQILTSDPAVAEVAAATLPLNFVTRKPVYIPDYDTPRFRLTPAHYAFLKIGEGCNHPCSFCIIPQMRGKHRSRTLDSIVREAKQLVSEGVKEINLISQDTTFWGKDLKGETEYRLPDLLEALNAIEGDFWIRLLYTHPYHWSDELISAIARFPKVARYIDIPLQHIDDGMLGPMRRETSSQYIRDLIAKIREGIPGIAIRTTFIVGFPGETAEHFQTLLDFIKETRFERLGIFTYSKEDGTRAGKMESHVQANVKKSRYKKAMKLQRKIAGEIALSNVGKTIRVLVEKDGVGRTESDAPEVDCRVLFPTGKAKVGTFVDVKVIGSSDYDLVSEVM
ncbi:MAG: 30S ribosomal protein S12 methylthiotransferase RimO [Verrucomicrobiota bacterium]|nr:30S ribosomal protein S12 methylthiotransferase RimO [Verrucomicrobiota bacterium]